MINILWPTIRPEVFIQMYKMWIDRSSNVDIIQTHVCVNYMDQLNKIQPILKKTDRIIISSDPKRIGVCLPAYELSSTLVGGKDDIVILASDDFLPPQNWDQYLIDKLNRKEGVLFVRDGYQAPDSSNMLSPVITIPIMTYGALEKMNKVIYHPSYNHMFSDGELYLTSKQMGLLIDDRMSDFTTFEHRHWVTGKRNPDQNDQNYNLKWKQDEDNWNKRKIMRIEDRIKV